MSVGKLLERAGELGLEVIGVSFHVGSGCMGSLAFKQAIADARHVFDIAVSHRHSNGTFQRYSTVTHQISLIALYSLCKCVYLCECGAGHS